jgi:hypothetical protein
VALMGKIQQELPAILIARTLQPTA